MNDEEKLKEHINNFVWQHAPAEMRLHEAETLAICVFDLFTAARRRAEKDQIAAECPAVSK